MAPHLRALGTTALNVRWRAAQVLAADSEEMKYKVEAARKDLALPPTGGKGRRSKTEGGFSHKWYSQKPKPRPGGRGQNVF